MNSCSISPERPTRFRNNQFYCRELRHRRHSLFLVAEHQRVSESSEKSIADHEAGYRHGGGAYCLVRVHDCRAPFRPASVASSAQPQAEPSALGWLAHSSLPHMFGIIAIFIALGHSVLAMSGEESLAQVYREIESPSSPT